MPSAAVAGCVPPHFRESGDAEKGIGLECFYTADDGVGGRLRAEPEDFVVEELSVMPRETEGGPNTAALVRARYWETNRLVREFARRLRVSRKKVMFAGTKDKRAVTTQLFVFAAPVEHVRNLGITDVDILKIYPTDVDIGLGDLLGNRFSIRLKDMDADIASANETCLTIKAQLDSLGGLPNFFGVQRFGAVRPVTHLIGRHMTKGDPEAAVVTYLCNVSAYESEESSAARRRLAETLDFKDALMNFPKELSFEKAMLNHLVKRPGDNVGALGQLPQNLLMMFVHAYQSFLFNRILSERLRRGLPIGEPIEGDLVLKVDRNGLPDHENWVKAEPRNIPRLAELMKAGKAFTSATLYGMESEFAGGEMGEIEARIIEEEGVEAREFVLPEYQKLGSKGTRRELVGPVRWLAMEPGDGHIRFDFELAKGCYATSLLREFMKAPELTKY